MKSNSQEKQNTITANESNANQNGIKCDCNVAPTKWESNVALESNVNQMELSANIK